MTDPISGKDWNITVPSELWSLLDSKPHDFLTFALIADWLGEHDGHGCPWRWMYDEQLRPWRVPVQGWVWFGKRDENEPRDFKKDDYPMWPPRCSRLPDLVFMEFDYRAYWTDGKRGNGVCTFYQRSKACGHAATAIGKAKFR